MNSWTQMARLAALGAMAAAAGCGSALPAGAVDGGGGCLTAVGTFNIRLDTASDGDNAWPHRIGMVASVLGSAEIWGIQEALPHQVEELLRQRPDMVAVWRTRDADPTRDEACPILFDRRIWACDPDEHGTFWLSEDPHTPGSRSWDAALPRICTYARLVRRGQDQAAVYVFNVHLDHRGAVARHESARMLRARIVARAHPDPVIVVGDFNAGPGSAPLAALLADDPSAAAPLLRDAWRAANPSAPEQGTFSGWSPNVDGPRIDFVLCSPDVRVTSASIDAAQQQGRWPSDHLPVTARLQIQPCP
jgi:endonuclease/exonuclease/phosphatase family metal-dependent hydrolase